VLDFRNNPGGMLTSALETGSLFLKPGLTLLTVRGRSVPEKQETLQPAQPYDFPLAIVINGKTASASEIVAGRCRIMIERSSWANRVLGRISAECVPLGESTGLALTTALYYTPSGRSIQKPLDSSRFALPPPRPPEHKIGIPY